MQRERKVRRRMEAEMKMEGPSRQRGSLAFFEAVLACCVATGRCRAGFRLQAEQVLSSDARDATALIHASARGRG